MQSVLKAGDTSMSVLVEHAVNASHSSDWSNTKVIDYMVLSPPHAARVLAH